MPVSEDLSELLFVYGTQRRGCPESFRMAGSTFVGEGRVEGSLHLISPQAGPGLVCGRERGCVRGELYRMGAGHLRELDKAKGIAFGESLPGEDSFNRVRIHVTLNGVPYDDTLFAWVHEWLGPADGKPQIPGGDWMNVERPPAPPVFTWSAWALLLLPLGGFLAETFSASGGGEQWWQAFWLRTTVLMLASALSLNVAARRRERMKMARILAWVAFTAWVVVQLLAGLNFLSQM